MIKVKRGDTFTIGGELTDASGEAEDLTGATIRSQIRSKNGTTLLAELDVGIDDAEGGLFTLSAQPVVTALWGPGDYYCDIEFTFDDDTVSSTETFEIRVLADVTLPLEEP